MKSLAARPLAVAQERCRQGKRAEFAGMKGSGWGAGDLPARPGGAWRGRGTDKIAAHQKRRRALGFCGERQAPRQSEVERLACAEFKQDDSAFS